MIVVSSLSTRAGAFTLDDISFTVKSREYAVLMGRTGCGKTTLLEAICGLKPVARGRIELDGVDVTQKKAAERGIGYVPQDLALFSTMTVREHLALALRVRRWEKAAIEGRVAELAELLGIAHLLPRRPAGLSGGEQQRVALGRALSFRPRVLMMDEPLSALDDETRQQMYSVLKNAQRHEHVTTLHVTHNVEEAGKLADRVLKMEGGRVVS
ncbi:MAG: ABC transporter ATP-binding protein [Phycisphaeraceae bacterium]